jgi:hypothetical protein
VFCMTVGSDVRNIADIKITENISYDKYKISICPKCNN